MDHRKSFRPLIPLMYPVLVLWVTGLVYIQLPVHAGDDAPRGMEHLSCAGGMGRAGRQKD